MFHKQLLWLFFISLLSISLTDTTEKMMVIQVIVLALAAAASMVAALTLDEIHSSLRSRTPDVAETVRRRRTEHRFYPLADAHPYIYNFMRRTPVKRQEEKVVDVPLDVSDGALMAGLRAFLLHFLPHIAISKYVCCIFRCRHIS